MGSNPVITMIIVVVVSVIGIAIIGGVLDPYTNTPAKPADISGTYASATTLTSTEQATANKACSAALKDGSVFFESTASPKSTTAASCSTPTQRFTGAIAILNLLPLALIGSVIAIGATMFLSRRSSYA